MKKFILILMLAFCTIPAFCDVFKVTVKGEAYIKSEGELILLEKDSTVTDDDTIVIIDDNSTVVIKIGGVSIRFVGTGTYKVKDYIK